MKKNKMMRLASGLLVAVLITTSTISGTFAKYVTEDSATDSARVAKFGVVVTAEGSLFDDTYINEAGGNTPADAGELTVEASEKAVAPGTKSSEDGMKFSISGEPEVDVQLTITAVGTQDIFLAAREYPDMTTGDSEATDKFTVAAPGYYPVKYTLSKEGSTPGTYAAVSAATNVTLTKLVEEINKLDDSGFATAVGNYKITWAWDFDDSGAGTYDKQDTLLGDLAVDPAKVNAKATSVGVTTVAAADYSTNVNFGLTIRVEQID